MNLEITYQLVGTGWSKCTIRTDSSECVVTASYLSDALKSLVLGALGILSGFNSVSFSFDEEPGEYRWVIQRTDANEVQIQILSFEELWGNRPNSEGTPKWAFNCQPAVFAVAVKAAAAAVLAEHGEAGYLEKWCQHHFPTRELDLLSDLVALRVD
ncbi:MAG: hypothetical protein JSS56_28830, partial [Proteobacteria bacterium]|nr:hypothetical protein [Pseudomonadota bacterium]